MNFLSTNDFFSAVVFILHLFLVINFWGGSNQDLYLFPLISVNGATSANVMIESAKFAVGENDFHGVRKEIDQSVWNGPEKKLLVHDQLAERKGAK